MEDNDNEFITQLPQELVEQASNGDKQAQYDVALKLKRMGAPCTTFLPWAERAAEQKSGAALCLCAMAYDDQGDQQVAEDASDEVKRDNPSYQKAVEYYLRAIEIGNNRCAHFNLALLYENGRGVERDLDAAAEHYFAAMEPRRDDTIDVIAALKRLANLDEYSEAERYLKRCSGAVQLLLDMRK